MRATAVVLSGLSLLTLSACGGDDKASKTAANAGSGGSAGSAMGGGSGMATGGTSTGGSGAMSGASGTGGRGGTSSTGGSTSTGGSGNVGGGDVDPLPPPTDPITCDREFGTATTPDDTPADQIGRWVNVTPAGIDFEGGSVNVRDMADTVLVDRARPSDVYVNMTVNGIWKSTDYGRTFTKINTGANGDSVQTGYAWYAAIDRNACRDPQTPPVIYITQGFGSMGLWRSLDGGVSWGNVWSNNIFSEDGQQNISSDVGGDIGSIHLVELGPHHLVASLHGYFGNDGNNGVFESFDGGGRWIVKKSSQFAFQPHNDVLFPINATDWWVVPGTISERLTMFHTTDAGATWTNRGNTPGRSIGRQWAFSGSRVYAGTDYNDGVYRLSESGDSWNRLGNFGNVSWVVATGTRVYASAGQDFGPIPTFYSAPLSDDTNWTSQAGPSGMDGNGHDAAVTTDGSRYVIIAPQHTAGIWRYVEP